MIKNLSYVLKTIEELNSMINDLVDAGNKINNIEEIPNKTVKSVDTISDRLQEIKDDYYSSFDVVYNSDYKNTERIQYLFSMIDIATEIITQAIYALDDAQIGMIYNTFPHKWTFDFRNLYSNLEQTEHICGFEKKVQ